MAQGGGAALSLPLLDIIKETVLLTWVEPALYVTVLPHETVSGCCLEAMPRSLLVLASVCPALLLCFHRTSSASHGSTTPAILQADPSSMCQRMRAAFCMPMVLQRKQSVLRAGVVQLLCPSLKAAPFDSGACKGLSGDTLAWRSLLPG